MPDAFSLLPRGITAGRKQRCGSAIARASNPETTVAAATWATALEAPAGRPQYCTVAHHAMAVRRLALPRPRHRRSSGHQTMGPEGMRMNMTARARRIAPSRSDSDPRAAVLPRSPRDCSHSIGTPESYLQLIVPAMAHLIAPLIAPPVPAFDPPLLAMPARIQFESAKVRNTESHLEIAPPRPTSYPRSSLVPRARMASSPSPAHAQSDRRSAAGNMTSSQIRTRADEGREPCLGSNKRARRPRVA